MQKLLCELLTTLSSGIEATASCTSFDLVMIRSANFKISDADRLTRTLEPWRSATYINTEKVKKKIESRINNYSERIRLFVCPESEKKIK